MPASTWVASSAAAFLMSATSHTLARLFVIAGDVSACPVTHAQTDIAARLPPHLHDLPGKLLILAAATAASSIVTLKFSWTSGSMKGTADTRAQNRQRRKTVAFFMFLKEDDGSWRRKGMRCSMIGANILMFQALANRILPDIIYLCEHTVI